MTRFAFIMVLLSLIVGLGITELLTGIARQIKERATVKHYWLHSGVVALLFVILLQQLWEAWGLQYAENWTLPQLLATLSVPMLIYIAANLLFPRMVEDTDFKEYYSEQMRAFWIMAMLAVFCAAAFKPVVFGIPLFDIRELSTFVLLFATIALAWVKNLRFHEIMFPIILLAAILDLFAFSYII